jgi:prolyl-tRNA editing enzyme YbaK/EbsC (Cys-tRNA(Pro) deacylase)
MNIKIGLIDFLPVKENTGMVAIPVAVAIVTLSNVEMVGVAEIDPGLSDTRAFCEHYKVPPEQAANCVIIEGKRGEERKMAAVVVLASTRADVNGAVCRALNVKKASFAQMEKAVSESHMEFGAITPIGLPSEWPILIDKAVAQSSYVIIGSGMRSSKLAVPGSFLASLPNARVIHGLAHPHAIK